MTNEKTFEMYQAKLQVLLHSLLNNPILDQDLNFLLTTLEDFRIQLRENFPAFRNHRDQADTLNIQYGALLDRLEELPRGVPSEVIATNIVVILTGMLQILSMNYTTHDYDYEQTLQIKRVAKDILFLIEEASDKFPEDYRERLDLNLNQLMELYNANPENMSLFQPLFQSLSQLRQDFDIVCAKLNMEDDERDYPVLFHELARVSAEIYRNVQIL